MEEKYLKSFIEVLPTLNEVMQEDITIVVMDLRKMIVTAYAYGKLNRHVKVGDPINKSKVRDLIIKKKQLFQKIPKELYGVPVKGLLTPVLDENGEVCALINVIQSVEKETKVEESTSQIFLSMEQLNAGIEEITSNSQEVATFIKGIDEFSSQAIEKLRGIDHIIEDIKNISRNSNFLALNATIEAARTGDAGRGFGVVAEKMGELSKQSKEAAAKVAEILLEIQNAIKIISEKIKKASLSSDNQAAATEEMAASTDEIVSASKQLTELAKIEDFKRTQL